MDEGRRRNSNPRENPCLICGSEEYIWGTSVGGKNGSVCFLPEGWI